MVHLKFIMFFKCSPVRNSQSRGRGADGLFKKKVEFAFFAWRGGGWGAGGNPTVKKPKHFSLSANMCQPGLFQRQKIDNPLLSCLR